MASIRKRTQWRLVLEDAWRHKTYATRKRPSSRLAVVGEGRHSGLPPGHTARQPLCAEIDGFSLHAAVRVDAHDGRRLEQLCRYIARQTLCDERVQQNAAGQVELKLKTPWRDGTRTW